MRTVGNERGRWGEQLAADYLQRRGYELLAKNFRSRWGEIDLIAARGGYLVFVEVKLRKSDAYGAPAAFVDEAKRQRIRRTAEIWLQSHADPSERQPRFDVIEIDAPEGRAPRMRHLENAF